MRFKKSLSPIGLFIFIILFPPFSSTGMHYTPAYFISTWEHKYYRWETSLIQYSCDGKHIEDQNHRTVYTSPGDFKILDFDWTPEGGTQILGVLATHPKGTVLEIYNLHNNSPILIKNMTSYHPWKIQFVDVDRDSIVEVSLGVYKKSPLHPIFTKRLFIFNFQHGLQPKWLGSRLSHPFTDFNFWVTPKRTILMAMELNRQAQPMLNAYEWDCFGFTGIGAHVDVVDNKTSSFQRGFVFDNQLYRQSLFMINQDGAYKEIIMNPEETNP